MQFKNIGELLTNGSFGVAMNFGLSNLKRAQTTSMLSKSSLKKLNKVFDIGKDGISSLTSAEMQTIGKAAGLQNPLINEFLAKAKDADFYSKAKACLKNI